MAQAGSADPYPLEELIWNQRLVGGIDRLLAVVMISCLVVPLILIGERLFPGWQGWYIVPIVFLVASESIYSHSKTREISLADPRWWLFHLAELVVLIVLLKLSLYIVHGFDRLWGDIPLWFDNFLLNFFDYELLGLLILTLMVWVTSGDLDQTFSQIEGDIRLLQVELDTGFSEERVEIRQRLINFIILLGGIMVSLVAILYIEGGRNPSIPAIQTGLIAILIYFICGLVLLSLTQYAILRTRWVIDHLRIDQKVTTRWFIFSVLMILGISIIAWSLPTDYSTGLLQLIQYLFALIMAFLQIVIYYLLLPFVLLVGWIMSLFNRTVETPRPPRIELYPLPHRPPSGANPWIDLIQSILFWVFLFGLVGYAFIYYFREHPELLVVFRRGRLFSWLQSIGHIFLRWLHVVNRQAVIAIQSGLGRLSRRAPVDVQRLRLRFINPRRMAPRQQALFYYLAMVRRGSEAGIPREVSQTPIEYSDHLISRLVDKSTISEAGSEVSARTAGNHREQWNEIENDITILTEGFLEARYSRHDINDQQAGRLQTYWKNILRAMRKITKGKK